MTLLTGEYWGYWPQTSGFFCRYAFRSLSCKLCCFKFFSQELLKRCYRFDPVSSNIICLLSTCFDQTNERSIVLDCWDMLDKKLNKTFITHVSEGCGQTVSMFHFHLVDRCCVKIWWPFDQGLRRIFLSPFFFLKYEITSFDNRPIALTKPFLPQTSSSARGAVSPQGIIY